MILKKIIIEDQKELYRHKNYLLNLNLEYDSYKKIYSNSSFLDFNIEFEIIEFLKNNDFTYKIEEVIIKDFRKQISASYSSLQIDTNNIFIVDKKTNEKIYLLNKIKNKLLIIDLKKDILKSYKIPRNSLDRFNLALFTLEVLASNSDDFKDLFNIFAILQNQSSEDLLYLDKIKKFKYFCIAKINEKQQDMFLCNCIPDFFPETKFYIKGDRIFSNYTNYFLTYEQEIKVWKYLYSNKNLVGVYKEPTISELFIGRKIYTIDGFGNSVKRVIKFAKEIEKGYFQITLTDGISSAKLSNIFSKDELFKRVIEARD
ncbi:hypothetical protein FE246_05130 [Aliarcobacter thereius]|uniref:Uncharacterized protein n=1 Tax=Aliarcobacter thereius TaxID=544718 RepID=A0A5R9GYF4_9BACT|nr:hypothetical protein [Aliarcobacter thereius]TLS71809.1 hypothetical protein FE246_05130 [Aliarcobacter thereius]